MFEDDERFKAVEKPKDRQELFENYLVELQKKVCFSCLIVKCVLQKKISAVNGIGSENARRQPCAPFPSRPMLQFFIC